MFRQLVLLLVYVAQCRAQDFNYLCDRQTLITGAGYNAHPTDCEKYIQCHLDVRGRYVAEVRTCSFGTHWNMELHTCLRSSETPCVIDPCSTHVTGTRREGHGNCRGYWECNGGISVPMCCPTDTYYNQTYGECLNTTVYENCTNKCFDDSVTNGNLAIVDGAAVTDVTSPIGTPPANCDKEAVAGNPSMYRQAISGWGWKLVRPCSLGTEFVQQACSCVLSTVFGLNDVRTIHPSVPKEIRPGICKPTVYLPFTDGTTDKSGNNIFVANENVVISNGQARFNGKTSRLVIDAFPDLGITSTLVIVMKYTSNHNEIPTAVGRALFSNDNCHFKPSLKLSENSATVDASIGTWAMSQIGTSVPQTHLRPGQTESDKVVVLKFDNAMLTSQVGNKTSTVTAHGYYRNIRCPLTIGYADGMDWFLGSIDEITIYKCNPLQL